MTTTTRIFGTDGIRGRAGEGWLSPEKVALLGWAAGKVLRGTDATSKKPARCLIGHDGRRSAPKLQDALSRGLAADNFEVLTAGLITTPGLAHLIRAQEFDMGVMISASHNPPEDNGLKLFAKGGSKLNDGVEDRIEALLRGDDPSAGWAEHKPSYDPTLEEAYLTHLLSHTGKDLNLSGMMVCLDCANGGGSRIGPRVFGRLGARVHAICSEPDGENINHNCGSTQPEALQAAVRDQEADIGIALDGDGDRCILVDERGQVVHGDGILTILARHAAQTQSLKDPRVVATVMSNKGLHRALAEVGVGVVTCPVGDRYVVETLRAENLTIGGEQSGHVILGPENHFTGDGLVTALAVLRILSETGKPLSELAAPYQAFPQVLINVPVAQKPPLQSLTRVMECSTRIESELGEYGRVLLRYSGTENLARVMVEGPSQAQIQAYASELADLVLSEIGQ